MKMQQNQQSVQAKPYEVKQGEPERLYELQENGDVFMTEKTSTKVKFNGREFITFVRNHEQTIDGINKQLSDETVEKLEKDKEKIESRLGIIKDLIPQVETNLKADYERMKVKNAIGMISEQVKQDNINYGLLAAVWNNLVPPQKDEVMKHLSADEKKHIPKIMLEIKKLQRKKK